MAPPGGQVAARPRSLRLADRSQAVVAGQGSDADREHIRSDTAKDGAVKNAD
jgi:hypothetical protein